MIPDENFRAQNSACQKGSSKGHPPHQLRLLRIRAHLGLWIWTRDFHGCFNNTKRSTETEADADRTEPIANAANRKTIAWNWNVNRTDKKFNRSMEPIKIWCNAKPNRNRIVSTMIFQEIPSTCGFSHLGHSRCHLWILEKQEEDKFVYWSPLEFQGELGWTILYLEKTGHSLLSSKWFWPGKSTL